MIIKKYITGLLIVLGLFFSGTALGHPSEVREICELSDKLQATKLKTVKDERLIDKALANFASSDNKRKVKGVSGVNYTPFGLYSRLGYEGVSGKPNSANACRSAQEFCKYLNLKEEPKNSDKQETYQFNLARLISGGEYFGDDMAQSFQMFCDAPKGPSFCKRLTGYKRSGKCDKTDTGRYLAEQKVMDACYLSSGEKEILSETDIKSCETNHQSTMPFVVANMNDPEVKGKNTINKKFGSCGISSGQHLSLASRPSGTKSASLELVVRNSAKRNPELTEYRCTASEVQDETRVVKHINQDGFGNVKDATICGTSSGHIDFGDSVKSKKKDFEKRNFTCVSLNQNSCRQISEINFGDKSNFAASCRKAIKDKDQLKSLALKLQRTQRQSRGDRFGTPSSFGRKSDKEKIDRNHYIFNSFLSDKEYESNKSKSKYSMKVFEPSSWPKQKLGSEGVASICQVLQESKSQCSAISLAKTRRSNSPKTSSSREGSR